MPTIKKFTYIIIIQEEFMKSLLGDGEVYIEDIGYKGFINENMLIELLDLLETKFL